MSSHIITVDSVFWGSDLFLGALCPSKSGLMNKHIVKHIVKGELWESVYAGGLCRVRIRINLCRFASTGSLPRFTFHV